MCSSDLLGMGAHAGANGRDMLMAAVLGLEIGARVAAAARGGFVNAGFHATGIAGAFGSAVAAGRLMKLNAEQHMLAQGVALSLTSGTLQPLQEGSWTKRVHPGWAGASGITAAAFARAGYVAPAQAYEGHFGLYSCFLGEHKASAQPQAVVEGLGESWEFTRTSIKLFPACHQLHAFMNCAIKLAKEQKFNAENVETVRALVAEIILGNTYHLMLRPGPERMERLGGLHKFMGWDRPILTDSGGFQVMSLAGISKVKEEAVTFSSHIDGSKHVLTPERSIEIQADRIGADISMQLDQCVAYPAEKDAARKAMELSIRWGARSKARFGERENQALFGIQQGSTFEDLRRQSSEQLQEIGFDGYAIGGLAVGEGHQAMCEVLDYAPEMLPADRPRYLMGVGKPVDLVEAVWRGVDMFDCVLPTRAGRHGQAWTWDGPLNLKNARFAEDQDPLDTTIPCPASSAYSKAYLHHLIRADEILGKVLLSWHNIAFYQAQIGRAHV